MYKTTTAIRKIREMKARKRVIQGSTSAGKTYAIIAILIDRAIKQKIKITICAETFPAVRDGAVDIFRQIMEDHHIFVDKRFIGSPMQYKFSNGSRIQFTAYDKVGKAKVAGKRDILFLNEANHIPYGIADALMIRSKETYIDFNPDAEFWAHTEILSEPNSEFLLLTFLDNEALPKQTLEDLYIKRTKAYWDVEGDLDDPSNIKSHYWANWWRVYGLGQVGSVQGVVLGDWKQIDSIPLAAEYVGSGMDFGYTNDPSVLIDVYRYNSKLIFDEVFYRTGLKNGQIAELCKDFERPPMIKGQKPRIIHRKIFADAAEPKSIDEIYGYGISIYSADKGTDSVIYGLSLLQAEPFSVTKTSLSVIKDLRNYLYAVDRTGATLNVPIMLFKHSPDAMRYWAIMNLRGNRKIDIR